MDEVGDEGGEPVVVAEADLVGGDGVVLVDDGDRAHVQELVQGAVGVAVVAAAAGVVGGEEDLADADAVARERGGVAGHEEALPDAGGGLLAGEVLGPADEAERGESGGDGSAGDEDDLASAAVPDFGEDVDEGVDPVGVEPAGGRGERGRADLDDDPPGAGHRRLASGASLFGECVDVAFRLACP